MNITYWKYQHNKSNQFDQILNISTKNGKCSSFDEILYYTQNEGVNSMVSILRDGRGCGRELKLGIEKQILCQEYYCYTINKT